MRLLLQCHLCLNFEIIHEFAPSSFLQPHNSIFVCFLLFQPKSSNLSFKKQTQQSSLKNEIMMLFSNFILHL